MDWKEKLDKAVYERRSLLCVGLDTDMRRFQNCDEGASGGTDAQFERNKELVDAVAPYAAAFKLNQAFYEVEGEQGSRALNKTVRYIREEHPRILTILDGKKGDIGNTSRAYARAAFDSIGVDSVTINAFMGKEAVLPFSEHDDKLVFILCRTSNPAAGEVQDMRIDGSPLYLKMASLINEWNGNENLGAVVGATSPEEIGAIRKELGPYVPLLVPGIGAQGGDLERSIEMGVGSERGRMLLNVSRGIMFAFQDPSNNGKGYIEAAVDAARSYAEMIREYMDDIGGW